MVSAALSWLACSTFGGDDEPAGEGDAAASDGNADSSNADSGNADAGNADTSTPVDGALPDGALFNDDFEIGSSCAGWSGVNTATPLPMAGGHTGARSCEICVTGSAGYMMKEAPASGPRPYQAVFWARAELQDGGFPSVGVTVQSFGADGGQTGYSTNSKALSSAWQVLASAISPTADVVKVRVLISAPNAGTCIRVDDVLLTQD
jgi:hypothetical protein